MAMSLSSIEHAELTYPYFVIRYTENSFRKFPILFINKEDKELVAPNEKCLLIALPEECEEEDDGVNVSRDLIVDSVRMHMIDQQFPMCVVFDEDDCVYLEHDGSIVHSSEPPSKEPLF